MEAEAKKEKNKPGGISEEAAVAAYAASLNTVEA